MIVFMSSLAILASAFSPEFFPIVADETFLAWLGKEVASGRMPYRDFFAFHPPLGLLLVGGFFKLVEPSLGAVRILSSIWISITALLFYTLLLRSGLRTAFAAAAALIVPGLLVPFWSVPSHHWFALGFGIAALLVTSSTRASGVEWFAGGLLVACAGLTVQTTGLLFAILLGARLLFTTSARPMGAYVTGIAVPLGFTAAILWLRGALENAISQVIMWPLLYYKQPGGFNDVARSAAPALEWTPGFTLEYAAAAVALSIPLLLLVSFLVSPLTWADTGRESHERRRWIAAVPGALVTTMVLLMGRIDFVHLVLLTPVYLFLLLHEIDWRRERLRPIIVGGWLMMATLITVVRWPLYWSRTPPSLEAIASVDDMLRTATPAALVESLPEVRERQLPVLYLSSTASTLYFHWAPVPPPVTWVLPPSHRFNSPGEYAWLASFADANRVPYIVIPEDLVGSFLDDPSALADLLRDRYRAGASTEWGRVFERRAGV